MREKLAGGLQPTLSEVGTVLTKFADKLDFPADEHTKEDSLVCVILNTSRFMFKFDILPCIFLLPSPECDQNDLLSHLSEFVISNNLYRQPVLVVHSYNEHIFSLNSSTKSLIDFVLLNIDTFARIYESSNARSELILFMRKIVGLKALIPYCPSGSISGNIFVGRDHEIRQIMNSQRNIALYGHRQSGKTSLMKRAKDIFQTDFKYETEYFDFWQCEGYDKFLKQITARFAHKRFEQTTIDNFDVALKLMGALNKGKVMLCLDEFDSLLALDSRNHFQLINKLHEASTNKWCKFIIAGYRDLYDQVRNMDSPLYKNFDSIKISILDHDAAAKLISRPFQQLGIKIQEDIVNRIIKATGRHPAFIQLYCDTLADKIAHREISHVLVDDIVAVESDKAFVHLISEHFLMNTIDEEQLILFCLMNLIRRYDQFLPFDEIHHSLRSLGWNISSSILDKHIYHLAQISLLDQEGDTVGFSIPLYPETLKQYFNIQYRMRDIIRRIRKWNK